MELSVDVLYTKLYCIYKYTVQIFQQILQTTTVRFDLTNISTGGTGSRGGGKGRGGASTLPYVIPCTSTDTGQTSDSSDGNIEEKRSGEGKASLFFNFSPCNT